MSLIWKKSRSSQAGYTDNASQAQQIAQAYSKMYPSNDYSITNSWMSRLVWRSSDVYYPNVIGIFTAADIFKEGIEQAGIIGE